MQRNGLALTAFVLFLLEGTLAKWIIPASWQTDVVVAPHLVLVFILYISIFIGRRQGLFYGLGFGLLHDIVYYGPMIGPYTLTMAASAYLTGLIASRSRGQILTTLFFVVVGNLVFEWMIYGIYRVYQVTHTDVEWVFSRLILPSVLFNLLFSLAVYIPVRRLFDWLHGIKRDATQ
ncbi:rod shape-determining protein MreD [Paenibacillus sp. J31TS4]|uniref:rod shape-determining protein MreD n=1 Tax=Paenibacillus sp. J31TS4 TaxID=2807195 RepID=UPI001B2E8FAE|nr:rod shape-determining protein MreD [Paenibacillus sp. J31TS4]GIP39199.1 rod shape-determining protein MreD [Paenibacillus sp. J31TS4]